MNTISDEQIIALLQLEADHDTRVEALEKATGGDCDNLRINLIDVILDIMGVPKDNTTDFDLSEVPDWPEGCFCRDWLHELWDDAKKNNDDFQMLQLFLDDVRNQISLYGDTLPGATIVMGN